MNTTINLFSPIQLGRYPLPNRIVMAPMTRLRAVGSIPSPLMAEYYAQRASAGLIIANPDLPKRFATDTAFNSPDFATFYGKGDQNLEKGYTDYPSLELRSE